MSESEEPRTKPRRRDRFAPRKVKINGKVFYQVPLGSQLRERNGRTVRVRLRRTFRDAEEAKTFAELKRIERTNHGIAGVSMDEKLRGDALEAQKLLAPYRVSILEAARDYCRRMESIAKSQTVSQAVQELLLAKAHDNLRPRYLGDLRARLARFRESFGDRKLADITAGEIDNWLRNLQLSPLTRNTFRLRLSALFEYARERGWVAINSISHVRKVKTGDSLPEILSPQEVARLLEAASDQTLPYWALGVFAGLRSAELERLQWKDIHFSERLIEVPALSSKTASRRFVSIRPNLLAWLAPYSEKSHGSVCPTNLRKLLETDRKQAGFARWAHNGLRHSFASYHLAQFRNAKDLALELGHSRSDTVFRHYHQRVKPAAAETFWQIVPAIIGAPQTQITLVG
jgi:integrase